MEGFEHHVLENAERWSRGSFLSRQIFHKRSNSGQVLGERPHLGPLLLRRGRAGWEYVFAQKNLDEVDGATARLEALQPPEMRLDHRELWLRR